MSRLKTAVFLVAGLTLAACSNASWDDTSAGSGGAGQVTPGSVGDPTSPAYFR